jgi:hypothetical protein
MAQGLLPGGSNRGKRALRFGQGFAQSGRDVGGRLGVGAAVTLAVALGVGATTDGVAGHLIKMKAGRSAGRIRFEVGSMCHGNQRLPTEQ